MNINDKKIKLIFGRIGCGKSCTLAKLACEGVNKHMHVYVNVPLNIDSQYYHFFKSEDFGHFMPEKNSLYLIDEVSTIWDNRNWKNFDSATNKFFRYTRHFGCTVIMFSQSFDVDVKIRNLCHELYISKKIFKYFNVCKLVEKYIYIVPPDKGESCITEAYQLSHFWKPFSRMWTFLPKYFKLYDSFSIYELPSYEVFYKS